MQESILLTIKQMLGIPSEYSVFDEELAVYINTVIAALRQLGVGTENGFAITGENESWEDYIGDTLMYENVKAYIYLKVRMMFDPPSSSFVLEAFKNQAAEIEWRIYIQADEDRDEGENDADE